MGSAWPGSCTGASVRVIEVDRPNRQVRRRHGKSDPLDAVEAARAALSGRASGIAKTADGNVEAIRVLLVAKRSARAARTKALTQIRHLGFCAPDALRDQLRDVPVAALAARVAALRPRRDGDVVIHGTKVALQILGRRVLALDDELDRLDVLLERLVVAAAPQLLELHGVGPDTAATLLVAAGDNAERIRSEAAWANLCGVAPLQASSGRTTRHRLNRGGNRQANHALWRIVITRMSSDPRTRDLRAAPPRRGPHQARDHPRPQALRRPRDLAAPAPLTIWSGGPGPRSAPTPPAVLITICRPAAPTTPDTAWPHKSPPSNPSGPSLVCQHRRNPTLDDIGASVWDVDVLARPSLPPTSDRRGGPGTTQVPIRPTKILDPA